MSDRDLRCYMCESLEKELEAAQDKIECLESIVKAGDEMYLWSAKLNASVSEEDKAHCALELHRARFAYRKAKEGERMIQDKNGVWREDPIHIWFGLTYASWLTLPRVLMQEMPYEWQAKMVALLNEIDEEFPNGRCGTTRVNQVKDGKLVKTPDWLINYRHVDHEEIEKCRKISKPTDSTSNANDMKNPPPNLPQPPL